MGNLQQHKNRASSILGILFIFGLCFLLWLYVLEQQKQLFHLFEAQLQQVDRTMATTNQLYRYISISPSVTPVLVQPKFQYTQESGLWALVNKNSPITLGYNPKNLVTVPIPKYQNDTNITVRNELVEPLKALHMAALKDGINLMVRSGYRSSTEQQMLISAANSPADAAYIADAGQSEHQMGLAVDFNSGSVYCQTCSLDAASALWLKKNASYYGFILRYPSDKVAITGYPPESWHYRYVGKDLALAMQKANFAYEEVYSLFETAQSRGEQ